MGAYLPTYKFTTYLLNYISTYLPFLGGGGGGERVREGRGRVGVGVGRCLLCLCFARNLQNLWQGICGKDKVCKG
jgi:hypothetical protein